MASTVIWQSHDLVAGMPKIGHKIGLGKTGYLTVSLTNRTDSEVKFRLAFSRTDSALPHNHIEWDEKLKPNGVFERSGIAMPADVRVIGYSSSNDVSFNIWGYEEDIK